VDRERAEKIDKSGREGTHEMVSPDASTSAWCICPSAVAAGTSSVAVSSRSVTQSFTLQSLAEALSFQRSMIDNCRGFNALVRTGATFEGKQEIDLR
jgi:hypothetical protein